MTDTKQKPSTINQLKRRIKELEARNEELRASVGYEELKGWRPNERLETQYGWVYTWLYPLQSYLSNASPINPERVMSIVTAILAQMSINGKYGIKIPLEPVEYDSANYFENKESISSEIMTLALSVVKTGLLMSATLFPGRMVDQITG